MKLFKGSGVALVTPFKDDKINDEKLKQMIEWHIDHKTDAIIICGTTGESATLSKEEKKHLIELSVKCASGRIPIIAGTGSNNTKIAVELSKYAETVGADGLLVVTPYYNKTTQNGILAHYETIANAVTIPIILYSVQGRTGLNIDPDTVVKLSKYNNIVGIKEASGDISQVAEIASRVSEDFYIYSGNDDQIVPVMSIGGVGVISVVANILPEMTHNLVDNYLKGYISESKNIQLKLNKLIKSLFIETNPIPIKEALNVMQFDVGPTRLPLVNMSKDNREILEQEMINLGLLPKE
ncbi:4-hydroxy-tetrahydrodipicolinate synthase [Haloplasma contractile]|uniref:4-hydroxy-tetrahydrodipicolinate synthase n=1 Tax=Haloplasma contractile SSD-17B TaxID=1033810 RepID=U2FMV4_9MOLU|nr:4-hydroxy-tetrahydrodipicolinate synthase [Haloplasma contractile]ERJ12474.1 4-hydroxy-tetrahydrodipicolinate synthase 1 protein [Haloplasma contractile SSD-17B]